MALIMVLDLWLQIIPKARAQWGTDSTCNFVIYTDIFLQYEENQFIFS